MAVSDWRNAAKVVIEELSETTSIGELLTQEQTIGGRGSPRQHQGPRCFLL